MSDPVTPLNHARYDGFVTVQEIGPRGMIALRGDLGSQALRNAAIALTGVDFPEPLHASCEGDHALCWMAPDEVLVMLPPAEVQGALSSLGTALKGTHHLAADISDARAVLRLTGPHLREVLAKLTPADVSRAGLRVGRFRRTRLAQVPAAFWLRDAETAELICFRSVSRYLFDLLCTAARPGSRPHVFSAADTMEQ